MKTFCNPLPLPDYPIGINARKNDPTGWLNNEERCSFRETADPSVIFEDGKPNMDHHTLMPTPTGSCFTMRPAIRPIC